MARSEWQTLGARLYTVFLSATVYGTREHLHNARQVSHTYEENTKLIHEVCPPGLIKYIQIYAPSHTTVKPSTTTRASSENGTSSPLSIFVTDLLIYRNKVRVDRSVVAWSWF